MSARWRKNFNLQHLFFETTAAPSGEYIISFQNSSACSFSSNINIESSLNITNRKFTKTNPKFDEIDLELEPNWNKQKNITCTSELEHRDIEEDSSPSETENNIIYNITNRTTNPTDSKSRGSTAAISPPTRSCLRQQIKGSINNTNPLVSKKSVRFDLTPGKKLNIQHCNNDTESLLTRTEKNSHFTVNLSDYDLSEDELMLLDRGLTFVPTYGRMPTSALYELQHRLIRNIKLKDYFANEDDDQRSGFCYDYNQQKFEFQSTWIPSDDKISNGTLHVVQDVISSTEELINRRILPDGRTVNLLSRSNNLSPNERTALYDLKNNNNIVIKSADKGSATVIMNKSCYLQEAYRQLYNVNYYKKLQTPMYSTNAIKLNAILADMHNLGHITDKQLVYLRADPDSRPRKFYLLPKIHKDADKWPQPGKMPEGRPIVSDTGSESYAVSKFVDYHLKPISKLHPSYIRDTYDFISKVRGKTLPPHAFLATGDVTSLYTNMNIDRIISSVREALEKHPKQGRPDEHLLELLEISLRGNDFEFNSEYFLQICGTAMGKAYAPSLADIYLEEFDARANTGFHTNPDLYFRFIDDVFFIWCGSEQDLIDFQTFLNNLIPGIKITLNWSTDQVNFLDTTLYRQKQITGFSDVVGTKVYFKPTDTHQLLHPHSFHPKHTCRGVIKSQFIRFKRICSTKADYDSASRILMKALATRHYSNRLMREIKSEVWNNYSSSIPTGTKNKTEILPIVVPFNELGTKLAHSWRTAIKKQPLFNKYRLITAYTIGKNLSKTLVKAQVTTTNTENWARPITEGGRCKQCTNTRCKACTHIVDTRTFESSYNNKQFFVRGEISCHTKNLVYLITCRECQLQYVGETSRTLGERIIDHVSSINTKKPTPISLHFNQHSQTTHNLRVVGIEKFLPDTPDKTRRIKESTWQSLLQTTYPRGINNLKPRHLKE